MLFIGAGVPVYAGMVVGETPKQEDISVNICKKKQLTNMRASGSDDALRLTPPRQMSLEQCLEFLADDDELLEVTPESLRLRKRLLTTRPACARPPRKRADCRNIISTPGACSGGGFSVCRGNDYST